MSADVLEELRVRVRMLVYVWSSGFFASYRVCVWGEEEESCVCVYVWK